MARANIYIQKDNEGSWEAIPKTQRSKWINDKLRQERGEKPREEKVVPTTVIDWANYDPEASQ